MFVFIIILIGIVCAGLKTAPKDTFYADYCAPKNTAAVNGIFSILIFLSHSVQYLSLHGTLDGPYFTMRSFLGQLVVVTYLFFSGYGIMESIKKKGIAYVKAMPFHRLFRLWYHFALIILLFFVTGLITGRSMTVSKVALAFTGYTSLGNSNWYMFATFGLYIIVFVSFMLFPKHPAWGTAGVFVLTLVFVLAERRLGLAPVFYNTVFCFPAGMLFSLVKPRLDKILMKNDVYWFSAVAVLCAVFVYFSENRRDSVLHHSCFAVLAACIVVCLMMKVSVQSTVLDWFGQHIFSFFMLQRIPMLLLEFLGYTKKPYLFIVCCFIATTAMAVIYDKVIEKTDALLFKAKKPIPAK